MPDLRYRFLLFVSLFFLSSLALATSGPVLERYISSPEKVGEGRLTYLFWDVYDASLFAHEGEWQAEQPFALSLRYLRALKGRDIADRSIEEIRRHGYKDEIKMASWHHLLTQILPDVNEGNVITGIYTKDKTTVFYLSDEKIGEITDPEFGHHFFGIWLNQQTSAPKLRKQLLALP